MVKHTLFCCYIGILCSLGLSLQAQEQDLDFDHLSLQEGLSQSSVYCILQDRRGFMWFGTQDGLNRYDGHEVLVHKKDPVDSSTLSDNWVKDLKQDHSGTIWVATNKGLNAFDIAKQEFRHYLHTPRLENSISGDNLNTILVDQSQMIWIGGQQGLDVLNPLTGKIKHYTSQDSAGDTLANRQVNCLIQDQAGFVWVGTEGGLSRIEPQSGAIQNFLPGIQENIGLRDPSVNVLYEDKGGNLWIGTDNGLHRFNREKDLIETFAFEDSLADTHINALFQDDRGMYWIATQKVGLHRFNPQGNTFSYYITDSQDPRSLSVNTLYTLYGDRDGSIWVGTYTGGVDKLDLNRKKFARYYQEEGKESTLSSNNVRAAFEDHRGDLWIGTYGGGLNRLNAQTGKFTSFTHDAQDTNSINSNDILRIYEDRSHTMWVGTRNGGLNRFSNQERKDQIQFKRYRPNPSNSRDPFTVNSDQVRTILEDKQGKIWIGTYGGGLNYFNPKTETFTFYRHDEEDSTSISGDIVYALAQDESGTLWVGTRGGGLNRFVPESGTFIRYLHNDLDTSSLSNNIVMSILEDQKNRIWIGTYGGGINLFDPESRTFKRFSEKDGLPNDVAYGLVEDPDGNIWLSTNKGISRFHPDSLLNSNDPAQNGIFHNYDKEDGLQDDEFNGGAYGYGEVTQMIYFGGIKGLNAFRSDRIQFNNTPPKTFITDFQIFNESLKIGSTSVLNQDITLSNQIDLDYTHSVFSIEFAALNYKRSSKNRYKYRLRGFNKNEAWNYTGADRRFVTYTNLYPGTYTFQVQGANNDGVWGPVRSLTIVIQPPFWMTWWFRTLAVLTILASAYAFYRYRVNRIQQRKEELENEVQRQTAQINQQKEEIQATLDNLKETQGQLLQADKMASLGQLTAGIAHEINNPVNFVYAGINSLKANIDDLKEVLEAYESISQENISDKLPEIQDLKEDIEFEEVLEEMDELADSIKRGAERTTEIVKGLRTFSRLDEDDAKMADVHENLDATLSILRNQLKNRVELIKEYGEIPQIECYPGKLNQVFMNILSNAGQAISGKGNIRIKTEMAKPEQFTDHLAYLDKSRDWVRIGIKDDGAGMPEDVKKRIFEPFFTTKEVGKGTGLGLSITHSIIEKHQGSIDVQSVLGEGTEFFIYLPTRLDQ